MRKLELSILTWLVLLVMGEQTPFYSTNQMEEDLTLQVYTKKLVSVSDDKFLSVNIDPLIILKSNDVSENYEKSIRMIRALSPAYLRLGGPQSNSYLSDHNNDPDYLFSENNWRKVNQWAEKTGLDVVACISPRLMGNDSQVDLVSLTDRMGFNANWQLGYECQTRCEFGGNDVGRYVKILRNKLNSIPRYSNSIITGPDVLDYQTEEQREYLKNFFTETDESLTAVTWHPNFNDTIWNEHGVFVNSNRLISDKNDLYEILGNNIANKPLWIAESKYEERKNEFIGALAWTDRLGSTAKLGIEVLMRQPIDLSKPTPDYWVSVLHKKLVGREVLDTRIQTDNRSHVHFYAQCTKSSDVYHKGALTIFGINLGPTKVRANVKGLDIKNLHEYVLTPGFDTKNRMYSKTVLLNGKPLSLFKETKLPILEPVIYNNEKGLNIELLSGSIGFWVVPDQKIRSCMNYKPEKENIIEKILKKGLREIQIKRNEISRKKRLIDHLKPIKLHKNKKWRRLVKRELDVKESKLNKIDVKEGHEKLEKVLPRKQEENENKKSRIDRSIDLNDPNWMRNEQMNEMKSLIKDLNKFVPDFRQTEDYARKNMDYDYIKNKNERTKELEEKGLKKQDIKMFKIDPSEIENNWINLDHDYYDNIPNKFVETANMKNMGNKEYSNFDYTNVWLGENIQKHLINQENDKEYYAKTKPIPNVASDIVEETRIKGNNVNMLMNYYSDSSAGKSNQENLEESSRVKTQGTNLEDSSVDSSGKTKLTLTDRRKTQTIPIKENKITNFDVLRYSKSIGLPMNNIPIYIDSKLGKRFKRMIKDLNMVLEKEMIEQDDANLKDCKCRVIRNNNNHLKFIPNRIKRRVKKCYKENNEFDKENDENYVTERYEETKEYGTKNKVIRNYNNNLKFVPSKIKRRVKKNYKETNEFDRENVENYVTEQNVETTKFTNENVGNYVTKNYEEPIEPENEIVQNEGYEEATESGNENKGNYETQNYEEIIEPSNENKGNYETHNYEETIEPGNKNKRNYETQNYEETIEPSNENKGNYETQNYEETIEPSNENKGNYETLNYKETIEPDNENKGNYETQNYKETIEPNNENKGNYETLNYKETIEPSNENRQNSETQNYEETIEPSNENRQNYETQNYEETIEPDNEKIKNYETEQLNEIDQQLVESIKSELEKDDDLEMDSALIPEFATGLSKTLEDKLNVYEDDLEIKDDKFFRGPSGQIEKTKKEININKDRNIVTSILSKNISSISKEIETTEIKIDTSTSFLNETDETEINKNENQTTSIPKQREKSSRKIKNQVKNIQNRRKKSTIELLKSFRKLFSNSMDLKKTEKARATDENEKTQENVKNQNRIRRNVDNNDWTRLKRSNEDLTIDRSYENSELLSKLIKKSESVEILSNNKNQNFPLDFVEDLTTNYRIDENLSKNTIPLSNNIDLMEKLDQILLDDNKILHFNVKENESSNNEKYSIEFDNEILNNEINRDNEHFYGNQGTNNNNNKWTETLSKINKQFVDNNFKKNEYTKKILQKKNEIIEKPSLNLKNVYHYVKEYDRKPWEDINRERSNKKLKTLEELWEFNPISISKEENNVDNFLVDFSQDYSKMKNNDQWDLLNDNNKSSFIQESSLKLQELITEKFDKTFNQTDKPLEKEFVERIDKNFNVTLRKNDKNEIYKNSTSFTNATNIFQTMITRMEKLFNFLSDFIRIFSTK